MDIKYKDIFPSSKKEIGKKYIDVDTSELIVTELRQYIRRVILEDNTASKKNYHNKVHGLNEVYVMDDIDEEEAKNIANEYGDWVADLDDEDEEVDWESTNDFRRPYGLQLEEEIWEDIAVMQEFQQKVDKTLINKIRNGVYPVLHSIEYTPYANKYSEGNLLTRLKKYGNKYNKDQISTCAYATPLDQLNPGVGNAYKVAIKQGFVLQGYPAFISANDLMSQTLGTLPAELIDHQKNSGIAKRAGENASPILTDEEFKNIGWAEEVILDNWKIIGIYMDRQYWIQLGTNERSELKKECVQQNIPIYVFKDGKAIEAIK